MESPNRPHLPAVDHLRAGAALLILLYHSYHLLYPRLVLHRPWQATDWINTTSFLPACIIEGHTAVALFLVVSGFILTYGSLGRQISWKIFYQNRFLRLFPLFFFILITGANAFPSQFRIDAFLVSILQFGYLGGGLTFGTWAGVSWSVSVEAHLYALFPALLHYLSKDRIWPLLRLILLVWLVRLAAIAYGADVHNVTYWTALGRIDQFFAGAVIAWLVHRYGLAKRIGLPFPAIAAITAGAIYAFHLSGGFPATQTWRIAWPAIEGLLWAAFVATYLGFVQYVPAPIDATLRFLGRISYSMYLLHLIVISIFADKGWFFNLPDLSTSGNILLTAFTLILPVTVLASMLTYACIEQPFLSMRRRYTSLARQ